MSVPDIKWDELVQKCEGMGLLAKHLYVVFTSPLNGMSPVMENLEAHLKFQGELEAKGVMFGAGPFPDDKEEKWEGEGMVIIRASSLEEARSIADQDPMHKSGARSYRIRHWLLNEGKMTLELTFSNKSHNVV